jgi:hypothetical protein
MRSFQKYILGFEFDTQVKCPTILRLNMPCLNLTFAVTNFALPCVSLQNIAATVVYVPCVPFETKLGEVFIAMDVQS